MRPSPLRHPLAILRVEIGLTQQELAAKVGRSTRTIQAVELRHMPLAKELALEIATYTGVDPDWLLEGDPNTPPRKGPMGAALKAGPYDRGFYEFYRAYVETPNAPVEELNEALRQKSGRVELLTMAQLKTLLQTPKGTALDPLDRRLEECVKLLLEATATTPHAAIVRWKLRRVLQELATDISLPLELTPPALPSRFGLGKPGSGVLPAGKIERKEWYAERFKFLTPVDWIDSHENGRLLFRGPKGELLAIGVHPLSGKIIEAEANDPNSTLFADTMRDMVANHCSPGVHVKKELHANNLAQLPCWTVEGETKDGENVTWVFQSFFKHGGYVLSATFQAPAGEEALVEQQRFVQFVEGTDGILPPSAVENSTLAE